MRLTPSRFLLHLFAASGFTLAALAPASAQEIDATTVRTNLMPTAAESVDFNGDVQATVRGELQIARDGQAIVMQLSVIYESNGNAYERSGSYTVWTSRDGRSVARLTGPTRFEWASELDAAGAEFGPCNAGRAYRINESSMRNGNMLSGSFVRELTIIGDTGGNDIEQRGARPGCNAHLRSVVLNPIPVEWASGATAFRMLGNSAVFCPTRRNLVAYRDGMANGDQDFGRGYTLTGSTVFRISADGSAVEADMSFRMAEDVPDHTTVAFSGVQVVARAPEGRRIVSFADGSRETTSFGFDAEDVSGNRRLRLTDGIANAVPRINLAVRGDSEGNDVADSLSQCQRDSGKAKVTVHPQGEFAVVLE